ncbi:MAG: pilus assembly protein TadG-related protein [Pseudomonadota bacterium]
MTFTKPKTLCFGTDSRGNIAMLFGLMVIPMVIAVGMAVDMSRTVYYKSALQEAADAAAIRAVLAAREGESLSVQAEKMFLANVPFKSDLESYDFSATAPAEGTVSVTVDAVVKPVFMQIADILPMNVSVTAEAAFGTSGPLEMAFVLDVTGSMGFNGAREVAEGEISDLLETIYGGQATNDNVFLSFVPYSDRVSIGTSRASWLSSAAPAGWKGCVEPRVEAISGFPFAETDEDPTPLAFTPTDPSAMTGIPGYNITYQCKDAIVGPTHARAEIDTILSSYRKGGTGRQDLGLAWAWRILSPKWRGLWGPADYPADYGVRRKIAAFITDGRSMMYCKEVNSTAPTVPPEIAPCQNELSNEGFAHIENLCERMKDAGVEIHVLYVNGVSRGAPYMERCASDDAYYNATTLDSVEDAFADIKVSILGDSVHLTK